MGRMLGAFLIVAPLVLSGCAFTRSAPPSTPTTILNAVNYGYLREPGNRARPLPLTPSDLSSVLGGLRSAQMVPLPEGQCGPREGPGVTLVLANTKTEDELDIAGMFICQGTVGSFHQFLSSEYVLATPSPGVNWAYDSPYLAQFLVRAEQRFSSAGGSSP